MTGNRAKPDFLFPAQDFYHDPCFPSEQLTILGVKSICKDRWRQVLSEADKIEYKHLLILESSISVHQTDEMVYKCLRLMIPQELHKAYDSVQQDWLASLKEFIAVVQARQS